MNHYRQSIILFGFVLPLIVAAVFVAAVGFIRARTLASFGQKNAHFASYESNRHQALAIEAAIGKQRASVEDWNKVLQQETASNVSLQLREISAKLPAKEFQQTSFSRPTNAGGLGTVTAQKSALLDLSFRANFRSMQRAFLELESRLPQLQLNELRIDRTPQASNLNFQVNYTAWED